MGRKGHEPREVIGKLRGMEVLRANPSSGEAEIDGRSWDA